MLNSLVTEFLRRRNNAASDRRLIVEQLDPLLKAADELQGKLRSLAEEDFVEFRKLPPAELQLVDRVNLCSTLFLFAQFWGRIEILRLDSLHAAFGRNAQAKTLRRFLRCLQSRRVRLVDRAWQRAIGESVLLMDVPVVGVISFKVFVERYEVTPRLQEWLQPLEDILRQTRYAPARQRLLQYSVIIHALIDTLDPKHYTTHERPAYPNKLSRRAKHDLIGKVFGTYLPEVKHPEKYTGRH